MPKDDNRRSNDNNKKFDKPKRQASFGNESPADSLLSKAKDVVKDISTSGSTSTNSSSNKRNSDDSYKAKRNKSNKSNTPVSSNKESKLSRNSKSNSNNSNNNNKGSVANKGKDFVKKQATNAASLIPGVGQAIKGAQIAKDTIDKIKQRRNNPNSDVSKVGKGPNSGKEQKDNNEGKEEKLDDNNKKDSSENNDNNKSDVLSDLFSGLGKMSFFQKVMMFTIPIILICVLLITLLLMTAISEFAVEFISSTIKGEELTEIFQFKSSPNVEYEQRYIEKLGEVYDEKKNFNPDFVSSTLAIMMEHGQYANSGSYGYSDIIVTDKTGILSLWQKDEAPKVKRLAEIFSKQPANTSNSSNVSVPSGSTEVAADATVLPPFGNFVPSNVVDTGYSDEFGPIKVVPELLSSWNAMKAAAAQAGFDININSGYRSPEMQLALCNSGNTLGTCADPGYSEHQLGTSIDVEDPNNSAKMQWIYENGPTYGFIHRYPTNYNERNHFRWIGSKLAMAYKNAGASDYASFIQTAEAQSIIAGAGSSSSSSTKSSSSSGTSQAQKMVELAQKELSLTDGSNAEDANGVTKYGTWYGMPSADWCDIFIAWLANQAGIGEDIIPKAGGVAHVRSFYEEKGLFHPVSDGNYQAKPGDLIFYDHGHVGLVVENNNGNLVTIEGNTSDRVAKKEGVIGSGYFSDVSGFASPNYSGVVSNASSASGGLIIEFTDEVRNELKGFLKEELPKINNLENSEEILDSLVDQIESRSKDYYDFIGKKVDDCSNSSSGGTCDYDIKGFVIGGSEVAQPLSISNLKVRLMQCSDGTLGEPVPGEELVDFEKYILGVAYAEVGTEFNPEAIKAEAIAARSYALSRPAAMNNSSGTALIQENGEWILQLRSCTEDQVYCDPDQGCSMDGGSGNTHYSGTSHSNVYKGPLDANHEMRSIVEQTNGQVLVNSNDYIINTTYIDVDQNSWNSAASSGKDVTEILISHYASKGAANIKQMSCSGGSNSTNLKCNTTSDDISTGEFSTWKQCDPRWGDVPLGGDSNICEIGCTITSIAMLVAKSGVNTGIADFNPGTFAQALKAAGITDGDGNTNTSRIGELIPQFNYVGTYEFPNSDTLTPQYRTEKLMKAKELLDQGYYVLAHVNSLYSGSGHWVAVDTIQGDNVIMMDPADRDSNSLLDVYRSVFRFVYYKVG